MTDSAAQTFADRYQSILAPVIFVPWAREIIDRAKPRAGEHILDLACGTGVVMREVAARAEAPGRLVGADHSPDMLKVARRLNEEARLDAELVEADAANLPFDDDQFDLAFCQQALQFFPDRPAALRELRRVLKPGGRVACCVQREIEINPMLNAQARALEQHVSKAAGAAVRAICSLPDKAELQRLFRGAGFHEITIDSVSLTLHHPDARAFGMGAMGGMHTGDKLSGLGEERIGAAIETFLTGLGAHYDGKAMRVPHISHVVLARA